MLKEEMLHFNEQNLLLLKFDQERKVNFKENDERKNFKAFKKIEKFLRNENIKYFHQIYCSRKKKSFWKSFVVKVIFGNVQVQLLSYHQINF